jgi:hypothetical protein
MRRYFLRVGWRPVWALVVFAGLAVAAPSLELVSRNGTAPGGLDSGRDGFGGALRSPVLDDGTTFFASLAALDWPEDPAGNVNAFSRLGDEATAVSIAHLWPVGERLLGNLQSVASSATGDRLCLLRYDQNGPFGALRLVLLEWSGDAWSRGEPLGDETEVSEAAISGDGQWLLLISATDGLYPGDNDGETDLFRYSIADDTLDLLPVPEGLVPSSPAISADGQAVVFRAGGKIWSYRGGVAAPVCVSGTATQAAQPVLSGDGEWVVLRAEDGAFPLGDANGVLDVFRVRVDGTGPEVVSVETGGNPFRAPSSSPTISADGRFVAFLSAYTAGSQQVWLRDCAGATTWRVSEGSPGAPATAACGAPALSPEGRHLTFCSAAANLPEGDGVTSQVYRFDQGDSWLAPLPDAPSLLLADDTADVFVWQPTSLFPDEYSYEWSGDGGVTWQEGATTILWFGNTTFASGELLVRVANGEDHPAGRSMVVGEAFTEVPADPDRWTLLVVDDASGNSVVLGTAAVEETMGTAPLAEAGVVLLDAEDQPLRIQVQERGEPNEWRLQARAPLDRDLVLHWRVPDDFPADRYVCLWRETDEEDRAAPWPSFSTARDMARQHELVVPAGEEWRVSVRFASDLVCDLMLHRGWNLVSLPIRLHEPSLEALCAALPDLRKPAWLWNGSTYEATMELPSLDGVWLYYGGASSIVLLVNGTPDPSESRTLVPGWNLLGPREPVAIPASGSVSGQGQLWNAPSLRYLGSDRLLPGLGCWLWVVSPMEMPVVGSPSE